MAMKNVCSVCYTVIVISRPIILSATVEEWNICIGPLEIPNLKIHLGSSNRRSSPFWVSFSFTVSTTQNPIRECNQSELLNVNVCNFYITVNSKLVL